MKRIFLIIVITLLSLVIGLIAGVALENTFNIMGTLQKNEESKVVSEYINMVEDKHDRELVRKAYNYLRENDKNLIDYTIKPEVVKVDYDKRNDGYYAISFYVVGIIVDGKLIKNTIPNNIAVGIDIKTEENIRILLVE